MKPGWQGKGLGVALYQSRAHIVSLSPLLFLPPTMAGNRGGENSEGGEANEEETLCG
jgi:hypothetical protein